MEKSGMNPLVGEHVAHNESRAVAGLPLGHGVCNSAVDRGRRWQTALLILATVIVGCATEAVMTLPAAGSTVSAASSSQLSLPELHPDYAESYWLAGSDGGVFSFGGAPFYGSEGGKPLVEPIVDIAASTAGYWLVAADGGVFTFGESPYEGSLPGLGLHVDNVVGMAAVPDGQGYWLVSSTGGVFSFGDAQFYGSLPGSGIHVDDIVAMAATPDGQGYWLVGSDGGVFTFGDAGFYGSLPGIPGTCPSVSSKPTVECGAGLSPTVSFVPTSDGTGYQLANAQGGVDSFGDATFYGSEAGQPLSKPIVGGAGFGGGGYWLVGGDGGVFSFGNADYKGSLPGSGIHVSDIVGIAAP